MDAEVKPWLKIKSWHPESAKGVIGAGLKYLGKKWRWLPDKYGRLIIRNDQLLKSCLLTAKQCPLSIFSMAGVSAWVHLPAVCRPGAFLEGDGAVVAAACNVVGSDHNNPSL